MSFSDIFKKSFLGGFAGTQLGTTQIVVALLTTLVISIYIFYCYRVMTRRTFYSKNLNLSLIAVALITAAIILTIQSSVVMSLGMVGALSIVRFRTAVKDPMDLMFLFWSISVGIICGAGMTEIAVLVSLLVTVALFVFDRLPVARAPMILTVNYASDEETDREVVKLVEKYTKHPKIKSRNVTKTQIDLVVELRITNDIRLTKELAELDGVFSAALLSHDGEVTF